MPESGKPPPNKKTTYTKLDQMRAAAAKGKKPPPPPAVAAAVRPKKENPRGAKARDERAKKRGRLPVNTYLWAEWDGTQYTGWMRVCTVPPGVENYKRGDIVNDQEWSEAVLPQPVMRFDNKADGLFRLLEELDVMFWEWYAKVATPAERGRLTFAPHPPAPAPWPSPSTPAGTAAESR